MLFIICMNNCKVLIQWLWNVWSIEPFIQITTCTSIHTITYWIHISSSNYSGSWHLMVSSMKRLSEKATTGTCTRYDKQRKCDQVFIYQNHCVTSTSCNILYAFMSFPYWYIYFQNIKWYHCIATGSPPHNSNLSKVIYVVVLSCLVSNMVKISDV